MIRHRPSRRVSPVLAALCALAMGGSPDPADAASRRDGDLAEPAQATLSGPPVMAIVSLSDQRVALYDAEGTVLRARVSSGQTGYETPVGVYAVLEKQEEHYSNLYDDASMPFMQRITWSGIALHAGVLPGRPASHGCVRMPERFAEQIFPLTRLGMRVIVARDDVAPSEITHPLLLKPKPLGDVAVIKRPGEVAAATPTAYEPQAETAPKASPFEPDLTNWPARQAQLESFKAEAVAKAAEARTATERADELRRVVKARTTERGKAAKALRIADGAKRSADERMARIDKALATAKSPRDIQEAEQAKAKAAERVAAADAKLAAARSAADAAEAALAKATQEFNAAEAVRTAAVAAAKDAERKIFPVSIFISLKKQRLYVRQGLEPVLDMPVTIAEPEKPIGTHIFTAVDYQKDANDVRWTVVSLKPHAPDAADASDDDDEGASARRKRKADSTLEPVPTDVAGARAALDRITLPPEIATRFSDSVWPGASLIVSDEEASKETGKATDFVVLISGEPQGGIKKRKRQPPPAYYDYYGGYDDYDDYDRRRRPRFRPFFGLW